MSNDSHIDSKGMIRSLSSVFNSFVGDFGSIKSKDKAKESSSFNEKCIICLSFETGPECLISLPCHNRCSENYVHKKCIFEWSERQNTKGSCPLCRGVLKTIDYKPTDYLKTTIITKSWQNHRTFLLTPVPKEAGMVRCYLKVKHNPWWGSAYLYEFYLQKYSIKNYPYGPLPHQFSPNEGDVLLLCAKKRISLGSGISDLAKNLCSVIDFSLKNDFDYTSRNYLGKLEANSVFGLNYTLYQKTFATKVRYQILQSEKFKGFEYHEAASVCYTQNRVGTQSGPRRLKISIPGIERVPPAKILHTLLGVTYNYKCPAPVDILDSVYDESSIDKAAINNRRFYFQSNELPKLSGANKKPAWIEEIQAYSLDFHGRVTAASNKNFQIKLDVPSIEGNESLSHLKYNSEEIVLQFGKIVGADECRQNISLYTVDFKFPLSPFQAVGICISACDKKMACA